MGNENSRKMRITVEKVNAEEKTNKVCHIHNEGEVFETEMSLCPGGICSSAFCAIYPAMRTIAFDGSHPWDPEKGVTRVCCPDYKKPVVFKIELLK